jgi:hypothetical protein
MASVLNRGSRDRPLWYAKIKDHAGVWRMVATKQRTKAQAMRWAVEKEAEIANGTVGLASAKEKTFSEAADYWLKRQRGGVRLARRQHRPHEAPARGVRVDVAAASAAVGAVVLARATNDESLARELLSAVRARLVGPSGGPTG